jgi:hypothetical protein
MKNFVQRLLGRDHFPTERGAAVSHNALRGYYIDLRRKATVVPTDIKSLEQVHLHVVTCQWGLGCYERYLAGEGDQWLDGALQVGRYLVATQETGGTQAGAWRHAVAFPHTFRLQPGWISGMAQGEGASLLVRLFLESGDESFAESAIRSVEVLERSVRDGGVCAWIRGGPLPEEYPTEPASHVLNGAIFASWGYYDVALGLDQTDSGERFDAVVSTIADNLELWDVGYWSRYDLYPHCFANIAAPWYHRLHIQQLEVLYAMTGRQKFDATVRRWRRYADSRWNWGRALASKAAFRLTVPTT